MQQQQSAPDFGIPTLAVDTSSAEARQALLQLWAGALAILMTYGALLWQELAGNRFHPPIIIIGVAVTALGILLVRNGLLLRTSTIQRQTALNDLVSSNARLRLAQSAADFAIVDWDINDDHAVWSSNFVQVFGIPDATPATKTPYALFIELVHPDDRSRIDAMHHQILRTGGLFNEEFRILTRNGQIRWIAIRGEVFCDAYGKAWRFIGSNFDITERRQNEDRLKHSLAIIELANEAGEIGVWSHDIKAGRGTWDERARNIFGIASTSERMKYCQFRRAIHPDDWARARSMLGQALKTGEKFLLEARVNHPDHTIHWVRIRGVAEIDPVSKRAFKMTGIVFDITERRAHEAHLRFLMRELTHRSKNLLAVIQAMARQTGGDSDSLAEFQTRFSARLQGLSASHDLLVNEDWIGAFIADIVNSQVGHFTDQIGVRIKLAGQHLLLKPEAAQNIGLALHELSTNAAKYGALSNDAGVIDISWNVDGDTILTRRLKLIWQERGGPPVVVPLRRGFGSTVTERIVARALDGKVNMAFDPDGITWTLDIPASFILPSHNSAATLSAL